MREIKFRAWHREEGWMGRVTNLEIGHGVYVRSPDRETPYLLLCDVELMQYTGLKDKTGREIYEGDIVLRYGKHAFAVKWNDDFCGFQPFCEYRNDYGRPDAAESSALTEVIGNIYENPELLQQAQN